jgi:DNA-binding GntR family transcriptional regulator
LDDLTLLNAARKTGPKSSLVYDELRAAIIALKLSPGAQIDKKEICLRLGVSRNKPRAPCTFISVTS